MLTRREIELVQSDWAKVEAIGIPAATLLYDRLFTLDLGLRQLFGADLEEQKGRVLRMLGSAIAGLSDPETLMPIVRHLGRKHAGFGVKNADYGTLGRALLWSLKESLGPQFAPENEAAWIKVYALLADTMKSQA